MRCTKCGQEVPSESRFCLSCGQPISTAYPDVPTSELPKKRIGIWAVLAGLCIVAALAVFLALKPWGGKVTQVAPVESPQHAPVVRVPPLPGAPQPSVLKTDVKNPPLDIKKQEKPAPPADVVAYLEHLKRVEKMRQDVTAKELNDLVAKAPDLIAKAFPFDEDFEESTAPRELTGQASRYTQEWQQISAYFLSARPPGACAVLAGKYYDAMREFIVFMGKFQEATNKLDLAKLKDIKRDQVSVDERLDASDQELGRVCDQYGIEKSFAIRSDTGQTPITGF
ncbi:MAG TPA: zinc ribbon domain-containing protein [Armatimonadota bacterium]|nr:zinc ribbon domain-containing protein [Armatimonadota bacterium]